MHKFIFDVDGTLTPSRGKMDKSFITFFFLPITDFFKIPSIVHIKYGRMITYAKAIKKGVRKYVLNEEEQETIIRHVYLFIIYMQIHQLYNKMNSGVLSPRPRW